MAGVTTNSLTPSPSRLRSCAFTSSSLLFCSLPCFHSLICNHFSLSSWKFRLLVPLSLCPTPTILSCLHPLSDLLPDMRFAELFEAVDEQLVLAIERLQKANWITGMYHDVVLELAEPSRERLTALDATASGFWTSSNRLDHLIVLLEEEKTVLINERQNMKQKDKAGTAQLPASESEGEQQCRQLQPFRNPGDTFVTEAQTTRDRRALTSEEDEIDLARVSPKVLKWWDSSPNDIEPPQVTVTPTVAVKEEDDRELQTLSNEPLKEYNQFSNHLEHR